VTGWRRARRARLRAGDAEQLDPLVAVLSQRNLTAPSRTEASFSTLNPRLSTNQAVSLSMSCTEIATMKWLNSSAEATSGPCAWAVLQLASATAANASEIRDPVMC
jgi:hypothetical protein